MRDKTDQNEALQLLWDRYDMLVRRGHVGRAVVRDAIQEIASKSNEFWERIRVGHAEASKELLRLIDTKPE